MPVQRSDNHPQRFFLSNELHARPFPELSAPCRAICLAIKVPQDAVHRDPANDHLHLHELLDHYGAPLPGEKVNHYQGRLGNAVLSWERHTEFVTYTLYVEGLGEKAFDDELFEMFPVEWLERAPGKVLTSALLRIEEIDTLSDSESILDKQITGWFVDESLAVSRVVDDKAVVCGDFRIDANGHIRFAILTANDISQRRLGRIVQRLIEIETYKSMAMLTLPEARKVAARVSTLDTELAELVHSMSDTVDGESQTLDNLLKIAAEIELLVANTAFRFGAAGAYEAIVNQRIEALREKRLEGKQLSSEFMLRRFDPAMRTCRSAQERLTDLSGRAARASNLLRTRVDVATSAQNQEVLESMNKRAELQLRLQETVEGLSVVAISYYAVNLAAYLLSPLALKAGLDKKILLALLIIPVVGSVLLMTRRIKKKLGGH